MKFYSKSKTCEYTSENNFTQNIMDFPSRLEAYQKKIKFFSLFIFSYLTNKNFSDFACN